MNWLNYIIVGLLSILIIGCGTNTQTTEDTSIIKKTGQVTSYDENGLEVPNNTLKDDGFYQKGLTPRYSRDDQKKIVTDHLTGLEWQDTADVALEDKNWMKSELMGECSDDYGNPSCPDGNCSLCYDTSGDTATTYCSELTLDGGGWRLPTLEELTYIVDKGKVAPSIDPVFKYVKDTRYFTSTTGSGFLPITVFFDEGFSLKYFPKVYNFRAHVRCVRGTGDTSLLDAFTRDIQGIVTSSKTKLQWQDNYETGEINASHLNWKEAIHYCETLELNGTKWRLPNINELSTITNPQSTLDSTFTSNSEDQTYWSSTTYKGINGGVWPEGNGEENTLAWVLHVKSNSEYYTNGKDKMEELAVRCVRDE